MIRLLPGSTLFPYTTLFRSNDAGVEWLAPAEGQQLLRERGGFAPRVVNLGHLPQSLWIRGNVSSEHFTIAVDDRKEVRSEEHTSELQSRLHIVCCLLLEKKD